MSHLKIILVTIVVSGFMISCNIGATEKNKSENHTSHAVNHQSVNIELNNGDKWQVNKEMKPYIIESENIFNSYVETNSTDYKTLASQLSEKNAGLIKNCTMKGKSHDELHKWLHPHMELIKSLQNAESNNNASSIISDLETSFKTYHAYFQ